MINLFGPLPFFGWKCKNEYRALVEDRFMKYGGVVRVVWGSEDDVEAHEWRLVQGAFIYFCGCCHRCSCRCGGCFFQAVILHDVK